jgi:hypothetical protein
MLNLSKALRNCRHPSTVSRFYTQDIEEICKRLNTQEELTHKEIAFLRSGLKQCHDNDEITFKKLADVECRLAILESVHEVRRLYGT